jgi:mannose-1-phosphate guanylyltransferase/phosphomannomutase
MVRSSGAELGVLVDSAGERLRLVDGAGRPVDLRTALLAFVDLVARTHPSARVAVPVTTSRVVEAILAGSGGEVVWTRVSSAALMRASDEEGVTFAGAEGGGYIFPRFLPAYDAAMSLSKLLELLATADMRLEDVVDGLPPVHVARRDVATPWEAKGTVMRRLLEVAESDRPPVMIDGVKVYRGEDWALVIPHPQDPVVRVWAEAGSQAEAESLAEGFAELVEEAKQ